MQIVYTLITLAAVAIASKAPLNMDSPKKAVAVADFPKGNVIFYTKKNNQVKVHIDITELPASGGPFQYHIHDKPVPTNANALQGQCSTAGEHFNPFSAPDNCEDQQDDSLCQVGDLSGKHGWIDTTCFEIKYYDPYLSLNKENPAYIVGKSVVFHYANLTAFACATIEWANEDQTTSLISQLVAKGDNELQNLRIDKEEEDEDEDEEDKKREHNDKKMDKGEVTDGNESLATFSREKTSTLSFDSTTLQQDNSGSIILTSSYPSPTGDKLNLNYLSNITYVYNGEDLKHRNLSNISLASASSDCENYAITHAPHTFLTTFMAMIVGIFV